MKFRKSYESYPQELEKNFGDALVETAGYVDAETKITQMILAGQRLADHRKSLYDYKHGDNTENELIDPTRSKNLDLVDAQKMMEKASEVVKAASKKSSLSEAKEATNNEAVGTSEAPNSSNGAEN